MKEKYLQRRRNFFSISSIIMVMGGFFLMALAGDSFMDIKGWVGGIFSFLGIIFYVLKDEVNFE